MLDTATPQVTHWTLGIGDQIDSNCAVVWRDDVQPLDAGVRLARPRDAAQARVQGRRAARPPQVSLPPRQVAK